MRNNNMIYIFHFYSFHERVSLTNMCIESTGIRNHVEEPTDQLSRESKGAPQRL